MKKIIAATAACISLSACDEAALKNGVSYTPPPGYTLLTDPDKGNHIWARYEGNRMYLRTISQYTNSDYGTTYTDYNCSNQTYRSEGETRWRSIRDFAPDSIGRGGYWRVCGSS